MLPSPLAVSRYMLAIAILSMPFQANILIYQIQWGRGFTNPYLSVWWGLMEMAILFSALFYMAHLKRENALLKTGHDLFLFFLLSGVLIICSSLFFSPYLNAAFHLFLALKLLFLISFYFLLVNRILKFESIIFLFILSMGLQSFLGICQFTFQSDFNLHILGEPVIVEGAKHLAKIQTGKFEFIRAYGTFPHPNVFGGFLVVGILLSFLKFNKNKPEIIVCVALQILALLLTFSRSALLALVLAFIFLAMISFKEKFKSKILLKALLPIFLIELLIIFFAKGWMFWANAAWTERIDGVKKAFEMLQAFPMGLGFGHFTLFLDNFSEFQIKPWEYQPVHNAFLLILAEQGLIGFIFFIISIALIFLSIRNKKNKFLSAEQIHEKQILYAIMIAVFVLATFDHYLVSLPQGQNLSLFLFALAAFFTCEPQKFSPVKKGELRKRKPDTPE